MRAHPDLQALLDDDPPDALILATPVGQHLDDARAASTAGVARAPRETPRARRRDRRRASPQLFRPPWIAFNRRFDPRAAQARAAINGHDQVDLQLELSYRRRSWAPVQVHDDALLDLGPHLVDWARWISGGELDDVRTTRTRARARVVLTVRTQRGAAQLTAATDSVYRERIVARTRAGKLVTRVGRGGLVDGVRGRLPGAEHPLVATLAAEVDEFTRVVRGASPSGSAPRPTDGP